MPAALLPEGDTAVQPDTEKKTDAVNYVLMKKSGDKQQQVCLYLWEWGRGKGRGGVALETSEKKDGWSQVN